MNSFVCMQARGQATSMRQPNPEAIAWYVMRAEGLLDDLHDRVQSLRSRGGQLAGFSGAVIALVGANAEAMLNAVHHEARIAVGISLLIGTILLIAAFVAALRGTLLPHLVSDVSAHEIANYTTERFTTSQTSGEFISAPSTGSWSRWHLRPSKEIGRRMRCAGPGDSFSLGSRQSESPSLSSWL